MNNEYFAFGIDDRFGGCALFYILDFIFERRYAKKSARFIKILHYTITSLLTSLYTSLFLSSCSFLKKIDKRVNVPACLFLHAYSNI